MIKLYTKIIMLILNRFLKTIFSSRSCDSYAWNIYGLNTSSHILGLKYQAKHCVYFYKLNYLAGLANYLDRCEHSRLRGVIICNTMRVIFAAILTTIKKVGGRLYLVMLGSITPSDILNIVTWDGYHIGELLAPAVAVYERCVQCRLTRVYMQPVVRFVVKHLWMKH